MGLLFASKALVQLLVNPFVGPLTNRHLPMFLFSSTTECAVLLLYFTLMAVHCVNTIRFEPYY